MRRLLVAGVRRPQAAELAAETGCACLMVAQIQGGMAGVDTETSSSSSSRRGEDQPDEAVPLGEAGVSVGAGFPAVGEFLMISFNS